MALHIGSHTVVRVNTKDKTAHIMNVFCSPMPATHGVIVVAMMVAKVLRMKQTPTKASPMI